MMSSSSIQEIECPFFDLPREIRDQIYDAVGGVQMGTKTIQDASPFHSIRIDLHPIPAMMRVSKQFSREYADLQCFREAKIVVSALFGWYDPSDQEDRIFNAILEEMPSLRRLMAATQHAVLISLAKIWNSAAGMFCWISIRDAARH